MPKFRYDPVRSGDEDPLPYRNLVYEFTLTGLLVYPRNLPEWLHHDVPLAVFAPADPCD